MGSGTRRTTSRVLRTLRAALTAMAMAGAACAEDGTALVNQEVTVGCGRCMFHMEGAQGCPFAAKIDNKTYMIQGQVPQGHQNHAPDGICNMERRARVDGHIRDGKLVTTRIELLPAEPESVPSTPQFTEEDVH